VKNIYQTNLALMAALGALTLFALFALPLWLLPRSLLWGWLLVPVALSTNCLWSLIHEAIHSNFHPDRRINNWAGRAGALLLGSSFHLVRFAHLMHHRFNRYSLDRPDLYDPTRIGRPLATSRYFANLLILHYTIEAGVPFLCLLPKPAILRVLALVYRQADPIVQTVRDVARQVLSSDKNLRQIRGGVIASVLLVTLAARAYGQHWPLLVAFIAGRGVLLSFFDNIYHFATPPDRPDFAWSLRLPKLLQLFILNMNFHQLHHAEPNLPWWRLPARSRELGLVFHAGFGAMAIRQLGGPVPMDRFTPGMAPPLPPLLG
jgi:fatty acid desaturase